MASSSPQTLDGSLHAKERSREHFGTKQNKTFPPAPTKLGRAKRNNKKVCVTIGKRLKIILHVHAIYIYIYIYIDERLNQNRNSKQMEN